MTFIPPKPLTPPRPLDTDTEGLATVSPTGQPILSPKVVPYVGLVVLVAGATLPFLPAETWYSKLAAVLVSLGAALGIASPGLRKP